MQTAQLNQRIVIGAPGQLFDFVKNMDKIANKIAQITAPMKQALAAQDRALNFVMKAYFNSALAKKRRAKVNLTAACNAAAARVRKTFNALVLACWCFVSIVENKSAPPPGTQDLLKDLRQANAPNGFIGQALASLRQELQTTKAGTHNRF